MVARHARIVAGHRQKAPSYSFFGDEVSDRSFLNHASFFSWQMLARKKTLHLCLRPGLFIHLLASSVMQGIVLHLPPPFIVQGFYE